MKMIDYIFITVVLTLYAYALVELVKLFIPKKNTCKKP